MTETCGARAVGGSCVLPRAHNMGQIDIPEMHQATPSEAVQQLILACAQGQKQRALGTELIRSGLSVTTNAEYVRGSTNNRITRTIGRTRLPLSSWAGYRNRLRDHGFKVADDGKAITISWEHGA